ncbi:MAG: sugar transferase [Acidobacteria bacterium]|nr:sugar transferase [Acidobacteriota bacterium]
MAIVSAFIIFIINLKVYSRIMLFGPILILAIFESIIFIPKKFIKRLHDEEHGYEDFNDYSSHLKQKLLNLSKKPRIRPKKSIFYELKKKYLKDRIFLFDWIKKHIDLKWISLEQTSVLDTHTFYNVQMIDDVSKMLIINLHPTNDFGRINTYFLEVYKKLKNGGYFVGTKTSLLTNKELIYLKYPKYLAHLQYAINFIIHRVLPKINGINLFYFAITKGRNRLISLAEILGRLSYCGFRIIDFTDQKGMKFFIAQKYKTPSLDLNPSYGPIIKLKRVGPHGHYLEIYKFRTMHPYSEYIQDFIYDQNKLQKSGKIANDYRLTKWGKVLRKFWIDELPQLANLFKGDLKLVGVRALSYHYFSLYPKDVKRMRFKTRPGIFPPYYADMPETFDEIIQSERKYLKRYFKKPFITDFSYFFKILYNISFKNARSR